MENKKKKKNIVPIILSVIILTGLVYGINKFLYYRHHEDTDDAQIEGDIHPIISRVGGYVNEIRFSENQAIKAGDTLVKLDDRDLQIRVLQAEAALQNAEANAEVIRSNVSGALAGLTSAQANVKQQKIKVWKASQDFQRYENLMKDKAITVQQYDAAKADKETAEAQLQVLMAQEQASQRQAESAQDQIKVAESTIAQKKAELNYAKLQLSYANIIAPAAGIVSRKNLQVGQFVQAGQTLFAIVSDTSLWVVANFKETQLNRMNIGQPVEVEVDAFKDQPIEGTLESFSGATGAKFALLPPDNATGNFVKVVQRVPVRIRIKANKDVAQKLRPGMSVKVSVSI